MAIENAKLHGPAPGSAVLSGRSVPAGAVAQLYGAYRRADGFSERALFVIDKSGIIAWNYLSPVAVNPGADGILQALEDLPK